MKFLGILRGSALFILLSAFHGPGGILCSNLKVNPSTESPTVEVSEISENPKDSTVESSSQESLPVAKSNLVFENSEWDDSMLASTIVFLDEFCKEVKGYKFSGNISEDKIMGLSGACWWVSYYVDTFSWRRVRDLHENPYEDALKPEKFKDYAEWLYNNLPVIRTSMHNMYNEALKLSEKQLETATSSGPYKYGFVQNDDWWKVVGSQFVIHQLTLAPRFLQSLENLKSSLENILNGPEEYTVKSQPSVPVTKSNLVFENSKWDDSMLASTFLFIEEFCKDVKAEKFKGKLSDANMKGLSKKCNDVSSFVDTFSWRRVRDLHENPYEDALKPEKFKDYSKWLKKHYPEIKKSIKNIKNEALKLTEKQLETGAPSGLSKYGFVCNGDPNGKILYRWPSQDYRAYFFMDELENLKKLIVKIL